MASLPRASSATITRRDVSIPHQLPTPYFFHDHNPVVSALFVVMSAMFPPGELFFIESVRHFRDQITDKALLADIRAFIAQEAFHSREHKSLNTLLINLGYPEVTEIEAKTKARLDVLRNLTPKDQLACTVVSEHLTANLAKLLLTDRFIQAKTSQETKNLWEWHALEELEHKSVAFNVLNAVGANSQVRRTRALLRVTRDIAPIMFEYWFKILARKDISFSLRELREAIYVAFGGIDRLGILTRAFTGMLDIMLKNFSPENMNTDALEAEYRQKLFGDAGVLAARVKVPQNVLPA